MMAMTRSMTGIATMRISGGGDDAIHGGRNEDGSYFNGGQGNDVIYRQGNLGSNSLYWMSDKPRAPQGSAGRPASLRWRVWDRI